MIFGNILIDQKIHGQKIHGGSVRINYKSDYSMKKLLTLTALGAVFAAANANAAGFLLREQSVSAMGNAFAGATAGAEDVSYTFYNPAGLSRHKGTHISLSGTAITGYVKGYDGSSSAAPGRYEDRMNHVVNRIILPSGAVSYQINDELTAGVSLSAPFGLVTDYSRGWVGANHGTLSDLKTYNMTPMMSYKANDKLALGAGLQLQYIDAELRNGAGHGNPLLEGMGIKNNAQLEGNSTDIGFVAGGLYQLRDDTRVGLSYRSEVKHKLKGNIDFDRQIPFAGMADQRISARLTTPALLSMGIYHDINDRWAIMAEAQKTYWSSFKDLIIKGNLGMNNVTHEHWKDVWFYSIGTSYKFDDQWKLKLGLAYDQTPVSTAYRTPRIPDSDRIWYSSGLEYKYDEHWTLNAGYTFIHADKSTVSLVDDASRGDLFAKYKGNIHLFGFGFNYNF